MKRKKVKRKRKEREGRGEKNQNETRPGRKKRMCKDRGGTLGKTKQNKEGWRLRKENIES